MASDQHPRYRVFPHVVCIAASIIVLLFPVARFLRKRRGQHSNSSEANSDVIQQQQHKELDGSQNVPSTSSSVDSETKEQHMMQELDGTHNVPLSTSSLVETETCHEFEVFLSFRGSDTRKTFTDYLYHSLKDAGIRAFRDDEELRVGEEIGSMLLKMIKQSKIAIPIFSKGYASSKWCLKEVAEMVKCKKETKQMIMPVFLDVTPDEVQHQTGSYADPFSQHEKRFSPEVVRVWRHALEEVVKLKGLELNTVANGNQGEFAKFIVARVIRQLKKSYLEVTNILVGIEDRAEELKTKLGVGTNDILAVGVWGMGGIGKTTLAKFVYNQIVDNFESSSFLSNIRETSKTRGLQYLQGKLASDILKHEREDFANAEEGINVLKDSLRGKKSLILLDDVDHINQLNALAADVKWFGRGSRIIITTREKEVLEHFHVQDLYEAALMDDDQALELFCQHAFGDKLPKSGFEEMARDIVKITGRLPLALEVIGSSLSIYGGRKDIWKNKVEELKVTPNMDVQDTLKISYESLDHRQKEIFLDIACFFIGMDVRLAIPMWNDIKFFPVMGIEILLLKALIKIEEDNTIWMHDQLRDLGRYIVEQENFKEPGQRSRLWCGEDAVSVLAGQQGTSKVEAISLEGYQFVEEQDCLHDQMFKNLPSLKVFELAGARLSGNFQHLFQQLRWLGWHAENESPSVELTLNNLIVLDLSRSLIREDWTCWKSIKTGARLKVLNLKNCGIRRTPDFSACPGLEILILESCRELSYVDPSIGLLKNLILLNLRYCRCLEKLPEQMSSMESLIEFLVDGTKVEELPISGGMRKLEVLSARDCMHLRKIPASIGSLVNIKRLRLGNIWLELIFLNLASLVNLKEVEVRGHFRLKEDCLSSLRELEKLRLTSVQMSTLPEEMSSFLGLKKIDISHCPELQCIPTLPSSLSVFKMKGCHSLMRLPDLSNLKNLSTLEVIDCSNIKEIEGLGNLVCLRILSIEGCPLNKLDGLERLEFLARISVSSSNVVRLPDLSKSKNMQWLDVSHCASLAEIHCLSNLKKLEGLRLNGCRSLKFLPELPNYLEDLSLRDCESLAEIHCLSNLKKLKGLILNGCRSLKFLPELPNYLEYLSLRHCESLAEIHCLSNLKKLEGLTLDGCRSLKFLPELPNCLEDLSLQDCEKLSQVPAFAELELLKKLDISGCMSLRELPNLSKLQRLERLRMNGCKNIVEIPGLEELSNLRVLYVGGCDALKLPDLSKQARNGLTIW